MFFFLTAILGYDIWFYISHRLLHHRFLYPIHAIHHEKRHPRFLDTYHGHWFETVFQGIGFFTPLLFFEIHWLSLGLAFLFVNIRGMMRHDDRGSWLIGNHHLLHHMYPNYNFGEGWLDTIFRTTIPKQIHDKVVDTTSIV
jgi:sterol desaturase/sphingolipid hydroxylase (fatty acid hydroxylase superfamily)